MSEEQSGRLSNEIWESTAILDRGSESVRAVLTSEENRFSHALENLQRLSHEEEIPIAIVGGLAAIRYGYPAATQGIHIVVGRDKLDVLVRTAPKYGLKVVWEAESGWHTLTHEDVEINIVPEGGRARDSAPTTIPGPAALGVQQGLEYASLSGWIELKLSSGRQKDRAHVVEVMKKTDEQSIQTARESISQVHQSYLELFDQLYEEAVEERIQEERRGQRE